MKPVRRRAGRQEFWQMDGEAVVRTYSDMVYRISFRYMRNPDDAQDVYSEVFLTYFKKPRKFETEEHRKAWLVKVTINCAKEFLAQRVMHADIEELPIAAPEPEAQPEELMDLRKAISELKPEYREVICMFHLDGLSIREISDILKKPEGTVKSLLSRAREMLRTKLEVADRVVAPVPG